MMGLLQLLLLLFAVVAVSKATLEPEVISKYWSEEYSEGYEPDLSDDEDPTRIPPGTPDIEGNVFDHSRVVHTLQVNNGGPWGTWGDASFCPAESFAVGYDMKIEPQRGSGDDTSLNGIKIICKDRHAHVTGEASSTIGKWGSWVGRTYCRETGSETTDYLVSFSLQVEPKQGKWKDDTAANYVKFMCRGIDKSNSNTYQLVKPPGHGFWGNWGSWSSYCPIGTAICGIKTKVEKNQYLWDDTALNDAIFYCCR